MVVDRYQILLFASQIKQFKDTFDSTVFPPFADPKAQAEEAAQEYWQEQMSQPCGPDGPDEDPSDIAEYAHQKSLDRYSTLVVMQQTVLNLFTAGVFHLFEQQVATLLGECLSERPRSPLDSLRNISIECPNGKAIEAKAAPMWSKLEELRLVANVVKHAEGDSADKLRATNGRYFVLPAVRGTDLEYPNECMYGEPLTGEGFYVTKADYDAFAAAVTGFWGWLAGATSGSMGIDTSNAVS